MTDARAIVDALGGKWHGSHGSARCPAHKDRDPSLSVTERDGKILVKCHADCSQDAVLDALRGRGLWPSRDVDVDRRQAPRRPAAKINNAYSLRWSRRAEDMWGTCKPLASSLGAVYLKARGCALPPSDDVRGHPDLEHWPSRSKWPAVVSRITAAVSGEPMSLHFTFLARDGSDKAPLDNAKLLLPRHAKMGGVIRLVDDAEVTTGLGIAEGIETALTIMAAGWRPVWTTIDAGNLARFPTLDGIETLTIFADHDPAGIKAARDVADRWIQAGREASITLPPKSGTDWNDELQEAAA